MRENKERNGKLWLAGVGPSKADIMFVAPTPTADEVKTEIVLMYGKKVPRKARYLECAEGSILTDLALRCGIDMRKCFYTSVVRYLPDDPKHRNRPTSAMLKEGLEELENDIKRVKPKIIVCLGKIVFELISELPFRAKESEIYGAWFYSKKYNARLYSTLSLKQLTNPEKHERYIMDFRAVRQMHNSINGVEVEELPVNTTVVHNSEELKQLVETLKNADAKLLSIDCEWHGHQHVDGKLRSLQIAWNDSDAAYLRFMDDQLNYVFDVSYEEAGKILGEWCNRPDVKYVGHHLAVDLTWIAHWLKLDWWEKGAYDTEFMLQCCDESMDLGLDALALRYTTFGKYDWDLISWKKNNPGKADEGYGLIPDDILIPYAILDVLTVMRALHPIKQWMEVQDLMDYWERVFRPLVIDVNTSFTLRGIPIDRAKLDHMRRLYHWARTEMEKEFINAICQEAEDLLIKAFHEVLSEEDAMEASLLCCNRESANQIKELVGAEKWAKLEPTIEHYLSAPQFNIRSKPMMVRWLYKVKKYTPIKSTANKDAGMPSISWEKVLAYDAAKQAQYIPATDTQSLEILAAKHEDNLINLLLELNGIGNITKAFLKESEKDDEGNVVKENGLHYWVTSLDTIALNHSTTETGRLRSWNPNCLNWPSWVHARLGAGMERIIKLRHEQGQLPLEFQKYVGMKAKNFPCIRGVCMARPGWCIVEADFKTAEMRGLAYISGDEELRATIEEPDPNFAKVKPESIPDGVDPEDCVCRLAFPNYIEYPADKDKFLMCYAHDGEIVAKFTEDDLLRDNNGNIVHTSYDSHWRIAEMARRTCREYMNKKKDRGAAKSTNFCLAEDTPVLTDKGYVPIQNVSLDNFVWDGLEWVHHKGVINHGKRNCTEYQGITATPDHLVWTGSGVLTLLDARLRRETLVRIDPKDQSPEVRARLYDRPDRHTLHRRREVQAISQGHMQTLWSELLEVLGKSEDGQGIAMLLQSLAQVQGDSEKDIQDAFAQIQLHDTEMLQRIAQMLAQLQRAWHPSVIRFMRRIRALGVPCVSESGLQPCDLAEPVYKGIDGGTNIGAIQELARSLKEEAEVLAEHVERYVYDVSDAGERHRFTAAGYLVANSSSYGGQANSIARKIESDTGIPQDPNDIQDMLDAIAKGQPQATAFLKRVEEMPKQGYSTLRAASGRIRHLITLAGDIKGLSPRTRDGQLTALGRECRNFYMQESVGAAAAVACKNLIDFTRRPGLKGYPCICLYDSVVVHCPCNERHIWLKALELYMYLSNGWKYERILRYPIDAELNAGWSTKPDKEFHDLLHNPEWEPTPESLKDIEKFLDSQIKLYTMIPTLSVRNTKTYNSF